MLSELHNLKLKLHSNQYNKNFVLCLIVAPQLSSGWQHNYSTKTRQAGHADEQSMYSLMSMKRPQSLTDLKQKANRKRFQTFITKAFILKVHFLSPSLESYILPLSLSHTLLPSLYISFYISRSLSSQLRSPSLSLSPASFTLSLYL